jgi:hypothetical protein
LFPYFFYKLSLHFIEEVGVMKRFIFCLLMAQLAFPMHAHALGTQDNTQKKHNKLKELVTILQISESQSPKFLSIMEAQHEKRKNVRSQYDNGRKEQRQVMKMLHQETLERLQSILTDSQVEAFKAVMAQKHRKRGNKSHRNGVKDTRT